MSCRVYGLVKWLWQDAHFSVVAKKTCPTFCAAWITGRWLALIRPRQLMPFRKPVASRSLGLSSCATMISYARFSFSDSYNHSVTEPRRLSMLVCSSLRSRSFQNVIQCSAYISLADRSESINSARLVSSLLAKNSLCWSIGGKRPMTSK